MFLTLLTKRVAGIVIVVNYKFCFGKRRRASTQNGIFVNMLTANKKSYILYKKGTAVWKKILALF